jgi:hypothetical protein
MVRSAATPRVSNHEAGFRDLRKHFAHRIIPVLLCKTPAVFVAAMRFPSAS